jgi:ribosomal subunit interface protein
MMKIQVNTDNNVEGHEDLHRYVRETLEANFSRFRNAITRIEVHIGDENSHKGGSQDKRCLLEARIANRPPIAVSHNAETIHVAFDAASDKLMRSLTSMVGRLTNHDSPKDMLVEAPEGDEDEV